MGEVAEIARFRLLDTTFSVDLADLAQPVDLSSLADLAVPGTPAAGDVAVALVRSGGHWSLTVDEEQCSPLSQANPALGLLTFLNYQALTRTRWFAAHAGVVAYDEHVIAVPGASGSGKSTLTAACLLSGFSYLSDEALLLVPDGAVMPYPKPLALSAWSRDILGLRGISGRSGYGDDSQEALIRAGDLGAVLASPPLRVTDIVLRERGALALTQLSRRAGSAELLRRSFNHFRAPAAAFDLVHAVAAASRVWLLTCTEPLAAAEFLADRLTADG